MNIVLTGGGSGGHIAPILAVAAELKRQMPSCHLTYIGQGGDDLLDVVQTNPHIDAVKTISAGKLRRYSGEGWRQLLDLKTQALNIRDLARTVWGIGQSYRLLRALQPNVVFTRGGFVSVPVALAARLCRVPFMTHDADSVPSLANRLIARWAALHAVTLSPEIYPYPAAKMRMTGIPVGVHFEPVTSKLRAAYVAELGLPTDSQVVTVTGGGNGARMLNQAIVANTRYLFSRYPKLVLLHFAGRSLEAETNAAYDALDLGQARARVKVYSFATDFYKYTGAADVVVARGGMGSLAELAMQQKACIVVPSKQLRWNVQNSRVLAKKQAIYELTEDQAEQPERLGRAVEELLENKARQTQLGQALGAIARPEAAKDLAKILLELGASKQ
ncbi:MAG: glycosyltransferase [Candidatus Saccharimonadales bacterium]